MPTTPDHSPDTVTRPSKEPRSKAGWLIPFLLLLAVAGYLFYADQQDPVVTPAAPQSTEATSPPSAPALPDPEPPSIPRKDQKTPVDNSATPEQPAAPPLPPYSEANTFIKEQLESEQWQALNLNKKTLSGINSNHFLQRNTAFLDGLSRGTVLNKLVPFRRPNTAFVADKQDEALSMGNASFQRYDRFTHNIIAIDTTEAAAFFHWTRPLLETAYSELGYPPEKLGNALISTIDILLATPTIETPVALKHESVLYQYADPAIEALPSAQKQMLRMGPENTAALKRWLRKLRQALLTTPADN
ncbi:MAG: hypothetical protein DRQ54_02820 [Gammaproteobacteria bacterium]|nr:MAG: hypothetical protein DRQ54_02820 [Gammaproteobacteria bacterium]RLA10180.1 MAG: hypothetical protein DRQ52_11745 [Gammaproteobacteria bacterium]